MLEQRGSIEKRVQRERIDNLYRRSKTASFTLLVISSIYIALISRKYEWKHLLIWYSILLLVLSARWLMALIYERYKDQISSIPFWLSAFRLGVLAAGTIIGSLNVFFYPSHSLSYLFLAFIFPFGVTVGALSILVDFFSFAVYLVTLMGPVIIQTIFSGDQIHMGVGALTFVLGLFFLKFSKEYNDNYVLTARLRFENRILLENLEEEKNRLSNRLGRIFNDSSIEIFVVDARTLLCLQVNRGAIENLGYSEKELEKRTLLDIFNGLDRDVFSELIKPLYGGEEVVFYKGYCRRKNDSTYPIEVRLQLSARDNPPVIIATVQDISERIEWERKLITQANHDSLTGLRNRHYIQSYMESCFHRAKRQQKKVALLFMDLDDFKTINDALGHDVGDELLRNVSSRIQDQVRESDIAARTGGDEFTVLLEDLNKSAHAEMVANKIIKEIQKPFTIKGHEIYTTISIGISLYPDDGDTLDQLMKFADMAMYQAKNNGRNNYCLFSPDMRSHSERQMVISNLMRHALANEEFALYYQPKYDIRSNRLIGAEALLRWHNDELGDVSPEIFIQLAENSGLINKLGAWVLEKACLEAVSWQPLAEGALQISVNISPQQFRSGILLEDLHTALARSRLPPELLELEITESLLLQDSREPMTILKAIADQGVRLALDDFGTGYSSLSYLRRFPLQVLKIDRSFISGLDTDQSSKTLVEAIIAMAHSLDLEIVAEGVENTNELEFLRLRNVAIVQGYYFSPPLPANKFRELLSIAGSSLTN